MKEIFLRNKRLYLTAIFILSGIIVTIVVMKRHLHQVNIVMIVMDTARQDHLSAYGYNRATSPNLSRMAETSRLYYNAYSTSGWTVPAHASLFTGLFPAVHGATQEDWRLNDHLITIAEILSGRGYETVGIVGNVMLRRDLNFDQGFSRYYETWKAPYKTTGKAGKEGGDLPEHPALYLFKKTLSKRTPQRPFFIFINLMEPHSPYNSSRQFYNRFITDDSIKIEDNMWRLYFAGKKSFSSAEIKHLNELYDAEILYVDYLIGKMIDSLKREGVWDNTVFIVTSDHGENIGDHGMMDHVFSLYESTIKVPLIIHYPVLFPPGSEEYAPVQLTDIFPTILEIAGIDPDGYPSNGRSLLGEQEEGRAVFSEYYYPEQALRALGEGRGTPVLKRYKRRIRSIILNKMKLIWGSDGRNELYDLRDDPEEHKNLIDKAEYLEIKKEMLAGLKSIVETYARYKNGYYDSVERKEGTGEMDIDTLRELKALGYVQ